MRVLITGGAGFIGSALASHLQDENEILVVDKMRGKERLENGDLECLGHFKNLLEFRGELFVGDILDEQTLQVMREFKPQIIFHQAAISNTTANEQDKILSVNLNSFKKLIKLSLDLDAKLIYASSAAVYGNAQSPQKVGLENPKNVYAFSKLMMDKLASKFYDKVHIVGLRYFNVYGKGEFFKGRTSSMILQFAHQILNKKAPRLFEGSDKIYRDFVYIKDIISANLAALNAKSGVYNVGSGTARTFKEVADILQKELGTNYTYEFIKNPYEKAYQYHTQAELDEGLGYKAEFSLEDGIKDYLSEIKALFESEY